MVIQYGTWLYLENYQKYFSSTYLWKHNYFNLKKLKIKNFLQFIFFVLNFKYKKKFHYFTSILPVMKNAITYLRIWCYLWWIAFEAFYAKIFYAMETVCVRRSVIWTVKRCIHIFLQIFSHFIYFCASHSCQPIFPTKKMWT